ncbi:RagB/SusD family nutrient uptake outer membrane protein [Flavobacterium sp. JP2137]|uniref:RagB/SusD family nutrient uptake outer membrane protein n=1 Tax=Flavobacterium sp. JP2137 TaxID=3414510 RepID=UPI003D2FADAE
MKVIYFIAIMATVGILGGCSSDFLDQIPTESIDENEVVTTTENLYVALNGLHRSLYLRYESQSEGGIGAMMIQADALGEDVVMTSSGNGWYNRDYQWLNHTDANSSGTLFPYRVLYRINRNANVIINNVDQAVGPAEDKAMLKGQALTYRAYCHFELVQRYGKRYEAGQVNNQLGVPLVLTKVIGLPSRATVEEVYAQINEDLDQAIDLLKDYQRFNKSHLDRGVALGLKARVALVQGQWNTAAQYANEAREGYALMSPSLYRSGFNNFENPEWMWGSHIIIDQTLYFANFGAYMSRNYSSSNIRSNPKAINSWLYKQIPESDVRSTLFDPTGQHKNMPSGYYLPASFSKKPYTSQKFLAASDADSRMDIPYMRAAEMYLIEAEAKAQLGADAAASQLLYELVKTRDPNYVATDKTGAELLREIQLQRRIELWGEGFRFFDLKRTNAPLDRTQTNHSATLTGGLLEVNSGDNRWQWLIPQKEINANINIKQNPL